MRITLLAAKKVLLMKIGSLPGRAAHAHDSFTSSLKCKVNQKKMLFKKAGRKGDIWTLTALLTRSCSKTSASLQ